MKTIAMLLIAASLCACAHQPQFEPNPMGAQQECATRSANLAAYNACWEQVDALYRAIEQEKQLADEDDA